MRRTWRTGLVPLLAVAAALAVSAPAQAASSPCKSVTKYGRTYRWSVVGAAFTCGSARPYLLRVIAGAAPAGTGVLKLKHGPRGYKCESGYLDAKRRPLAGACFKGTLAFPVSGFQWLGG
jgi:hypothetical protein